MGAGDVAGNRKPEAGAAFVLVAGIVQPQERLEHFFAQMRGNAGSVVVDRHGQITVIALAGDGDALAVANRCDATLLVVRAFGEKRGMVGRLCNELNEARAQFLGVVVNAARASAGGYLKGNIQASHEYHTSQSPEA